MGVWTTTPRTWAAAEQVTATLLNEQLRDFGAAFGAWTSYTPTLVQSSSVAKTVTRAAYTQVGKTVMGNFLLTPSASGVSGSWVLAGLPVTAAAGQSILGSGAIYDLSTTTHYPCVLTVFTGSVSVAFRRTDVADSTPWAWGASPLLALASGDQIYGSFVYEAA